MSNPERNKLFAESYGGLSGKILLASLGSLLVGKESNVRIRGTKAEISTLSAALFATKKLQEELNRPDASVNLVMERLKEKHRAADEFSKTFGFPWPL